MTDAPKQRHLDPTQESGRGFLARGIRGSIVMLNLLRFRDVADYSANPGLAPGRPMTGEEAYRLYVRHTLPHLEASGGELLFFGKGGPFLIGPPDERWDAAMLVRQRSVEDFMAFASNRAYLAGIGHRVAALEDSRLLPLVEEDAEAGAAGDRARPMASRYVIAVRDLERSVRYYRDVLGFEASEVGDPGWRFLVRGACFIMAGECPDALPAAQLGDHSYFAYVEVDDADRLHAEVTAKGAEVIKPLRSEPWGMREFGIRTLDGHRIMFGAGIEDGG